MVFDVLLREPHRLRYLTIPLPIDPAPDENASCPFRLLAQDPGDNLAYFSESYRIILIPVEG